jgi:hypothetical protein
MGRKLVFGKITIGAGDCLDVLVSGRRYVLKVTDITEYSQIVGETPGGDPVMVRASKIVALRKIPQEVFDAMKANTSGATNNAE